MVFCRNVQLMPTLFLKRTKIRQRENGKFVDFNDLAQVVEMDEFAVFPLPYLRKFQK